MDGKWAADQQTDWLQIKMIQGVFAVKMILQQINLTNQLACQSTVPTNKQRQRRIWAELNKYKNGQANTYAGTNVHMNIAVSDIKLKPSLKVGFVALIWQWRTLPS